jgi:hypothetical protein
MIAAVSTTMFVSPFIFLPIASRSFAIDRCKAESSDQRLFVKSPFSTHGLGPKLCRSDHGYMARYITTVANIMTKTKPPVNNKPPLYLNYLLLQPAIRNRKEYKCVFINGVFQHEYNCSTNIGPAFSHGNHDRLIQFAADAISLLKKRCPSTMVDGLVRVDIMETQDLEEFVPLDAAFMGSFDWFVAENGRYYRRRLVVNEFEGIQPNYKDSEEVDVLLGEYFIHSVGSIYSIST